MRERSREQHLIDIFFEMIMLTRYNKWCQQADREDLAAWVRSNLTSAGFKTEPCGSSWAILVDENGKAL